MKKLQLKKEVVSRLNDDQMNRAKGGATENCTTDDLLCTTVDMFGMACRRGDPTSMATASCTCPSLNVPFCITPTMVIGCL